MSRFIIIEGGDGAGKSTLATKLAIELERLGDSVLVVSDLVSSPKAKEVHSLVVKRAVGDNFTPNAELLLLYAGRWQHLYDTVIPALQKGQTVISDRFEATTFAYQVYARGADLGLWQQLHQKTLAILEPFVTTAQYFHLQATNATTAKRRVEAGKTNDAFDGLSADFHQKTLAGYQAVVEQLDPAYAWQVIDAEQPADQVFTEVLSYWLKKTRL